MAAGLLLTIEPCFGLVRSNPAAPEKYLDRGCCYGQEYTTHKNEQTKKISGFRIYK